MKIYLKPEYVAPYLPYSAKVLHKGICQELVYVGKEKIAFTSCGKVHRYLWKYATLRLKLILRPLSDFDKFKNQFDIYIDKDLDIDTDSSYGFLEFNQYYSQVSKLFELHFDVFGLIDKGLAVDINKIN